MRKTYGIKRFIDELRKSPLSLKTMQKMRKKHTVYAGFDENQRNMLNLMKPRKSPEA